MPNDRFQRLLIKIFNPVIELAEKIDSNEKIILVGNTINKYDPVLVSLLTDNIHFILKNDNCFYRNLDREIIDLSNKDISNLRNAFISMVENKKLCIFPFNEDLVIPNNNYLNLLSKTDCKIIPFGISGSYNLSKGKIKIATGNSFLSTDYYDKKSLKEKCEVEVKSLIKK